MTDETDTVQCCRAQCDDEFHEIEAAFGPMSVYVSGTDTESVQETFDHVWETMMDTSEKMKEMGDEGTDENDGGPAFGD